MKHKDLVAKAREWLVYSKQCNPVFTEKGSMRCGEFPDAIGWTVDDCLVVECKISVSDFRADAKKEARLNDQALGNLRYFLMPSDVYDQVKNEIPEGWGHLTISTLGGSIGSVSQVRFMGSKEHNRHLKLESNFLRSRILEIQRFGR